MRRVVDEVGQTAVDDAHTIDAQAWNVDPAWRSDTPARATTATNARPPRSAVCGTHPAADAGSRGIRIPCVASRPAAGQPSEAGRPVHGAASGGETAGAPADVEQIQTGRASTGSKPRLHSRRHAMDRRSGTSRRGPRGRWQREAPRSRWQGPLPVAAAAGVRGRVCSRRSRGHRRSHCRVVRCRTARARATTSHHVDRKRNPNPHVPGFSSPPADDDQHDQGDHVEWNTNRTVSTHRTYKSGRSDRRAWRRGCRHTPCQWRLPTFPRAAQSTRRAMPSCRRENRGGANRVMSDGNPLIVRIQKNGQEQDQMVEAASPRCDGPATRPALPKRSSSARCGQRGMAPEAALRLLGQATLNARLRPRGIVRST